MQRALFVSEIFNSGLDLRDGVVVRVAKYREIRKLGFGVLNVHVFELDGPHDLDNLLIRLALQGMLQKRKHGLLHTFLLANSPNMCQREASLLIVTVDEPANVVLNRIRGATPQQVAKIPLKPKLAHRCQYVQPHVLLTDNSAACWGFAELALVVQRSFHIICHKRRYQAAFWLLTVPHWSFHPHPTSRPA